MNVSQANIIVQIHFVESATCLDELAQEYGFDVSSVERLTDKLVYMHTLYLNNTANVVMRCCDIVDLDLYRSCTLCADTSALLYCY